MAPYEALYERKFQTPLRWYKDGESMIVGSEMGDHVFLRVTPTTGVHKAMKSKKLTLKFIRPHKISARIGPVAYRIAFPPILSKIHDVFHVSQLRKYLTDMSHVIKLDTIQLKDNLSFEVLPVRIDDRKIKRLRNKDVSLVKVIWNPTTGDASWELESKMREQHPELFIDVLFRG
ncbi:uncharacterized protein [Cicer arietinum]|uniref:Uncharacterized protein LOC101498585 n=1 Tax=Cicer arietinum TaxID=3827 RepID=A0A1S2Z3N9_CICAR|nr:uncharacterized protein LOC101498585 [Cicer arietinum]